MFTETQNLKNNTQPFFPTCKINDISSREARFDFSPRETAGNDLINNLLFQYNYAILLLLITIYNEYKENPNYQDIAVSVEYYEDVVLIRNTSDQNNTSYELFQVKANDKHLTITSIAPRNKDPSSIINKLILKKNTDDHEFYNPPYIKSINLVSANGFNFIKKDNQQYTQQSVPFDLLEEKYKHYLSNHINIKNKKDFFNKLHFVIPGASKGSINLAIKGLISTIVEEFHPGRRHDPNAIYRVISQALFEIGKIKPNEHIKLSQKILTVSQFQQIVNNNTDTKIENDIINEAKEYIQYSSYGQPAKTKIRKELDKCPTRTLETCGIYAEIKNVILSTEFRETINSSNDDINDLKPLIDEFIHSQQLFEKYSKQNQYIIIAIIFYELAKYIQDSTN